MVSNEIVGVCLQFPLYGTLQTREFSGLGLCDVATRSYMNAPSRNDTLRLYPSESRCEYESHSRVDLRPAVFDGGRGSDGDAPVARYLDVVSVYGELDAHVCT